MEELPFTKYGFQLYEPGDLTALAKQANFKVDVIQTLEETLRNKGGDTMNRTYSVLCLKKAKQ
ncbi:hypothetical protein [Pseudopedobacter saltans]|uniref:hypothetical protein n=1 Tax=Pseudopedobacter saltans TaxID=151895 RepID=UPI0002E5657B|nr:hypothetical protein [Pseudopedobacter saltans]